MIIRYDLSYDCARGGYCTVSAAASRRHVAEEESARKKTPTTQNLGEQNKKIPYSPSSHIEEARPTNPE